MAKARKKTDPGASKESRRESSSEFFERIRPKFLDWVPPSQEELRLEAQKRRDDRDAELKKVTALEKAKLAEKKSGKKKLPAS